MRFDKYILADVLNLTSGIMRCRIATWKTGMLFSIAGYGYRFQYKRSLATIDNDTQTKLAGAGIRELLTAIKFSKML